MVKGFWKKLIFKQPFLFGKLPLVVTPQAPAYLPPGRPPPPSSCPLRSHLRPHHYSPAPRPRARGSAPACTGGHRFQEMDKYCWANFAGGTDLLPDVGARLLGLALLLHVELGPLLLLVLDGLLPQSLLTGDR